jgi:hypothetical protein
MQITDANNRLISSSVNGVPSNSSLAKTRPVTQGRPRNRRRPGLPASRRLSGRCGPRPARAALARRTDPQSRHASGPRRSASYPWPRRGPTSAGPGGPRRCRAPVPDRAERAAPGRRGRRTPPLRPRSRTVSRLRAGTDPTASVNERRRHDGSSQRHLRLRHTSSGRRPPMGRSRGRVVRCPFERRARVPHSAQHRARSSAVANRTTKPSGLSSTEVTARPSRPNSRVVPSSMPWLSLVTSLIRHQNDHGEPRSISRGQSHLDADQRSMPNPHQVR